MAEGLTDPSQFVFRQDDPPRAGFEKERNLDEHMNQIAEELNLQEFPHGPVVQVASRVKEHLAEFPRQSQKVREIFNEPISERKNIDEELIGNRGDLDFVFGNGFPPPYLDYGTLHDFSASLDGLIATNDSGKGRFSDKWDFKGDDYKTVVDQLLRINEIYEEMRASIFDRNPQLQEIWQPLADALVGANEFQRIDVNKPVDEEMIQKLFKLNGAPITSMNRTSWKEEEIPHNMGGYRLGLDAKFGSIYRKAVLSSVDSSECDDYLVRLSDALVSLGEAYSRLPKKQS